MADFLYSIGEYLLLINFIALFISALVFPQRTAFMSVLVLIVILQISHMWYEPYMKNVLALTYSKEEIRMFWYMGFAVSDFLVVLFAATYCKVFNVVRDKASNLVLINLAALGSIQMIRYADRQLIGTDILGGFYGTAIPTLNFTITAIICFYLVYFCGASLFNSILKIISKGV